MRAWMDGYGGKCNNRQSGYRVLTHVSPPAATIFYMPSTAPPGQRKQRVAAMGRPLIRSMTGLLLRRTSCLRYVCVYIQLYVYICVYTYHNTPLFVSVTYTKFLNKKGHELMRRIEYDTWVKLPLQRPPEPKAVIAVARARQSASGTLGTQGLECVGFKVR